MNEQLVGNDDGVTESGVATPAPTARLGAGHPKQGGDDDRLASAGDDRVKHYFTDTVEPHWSQAAKCGKGPAVGDGPSDARLGFCTECLPVEPEDLEDVEAIHA